MFSSLPPGIRSQKQDPICGNVLLGLKGFGRSMNQGKLEMVKQEMARVNVDILGNNELRWTENSSKCILKMSSFIIHEFFLNKLFRKDSIVPLPKITKTHKTKKK